jgi:hypothetical protein
LQVDRLGRVETGRLLLAADPALDVRQERRPPSRFVEYRAQQERCRRLAVRARHRHDLELARGVAEEQDGRRPHRRTHARHQQLRDVRLDLPFDDEGDCTGCHRLGRELVAVGPGAGNAEEERAWSDGARVVGEVEDLDRRLAGSPDRLRKAVQIHQGKLSGGDLRRPRSNRQLAVTAEGTSPSGAST